MTERLAQRGISDDFVLQFEHGVLRPILERLRHDDTIGLEIRSGYVNIYYRGGNLLRLTAGKGTLRFGAVFDWRYLGGDGEYTCWTPPERPPSVIQSLDDAEAWVDAFPHLKQAMDIRFARHPRIEREYQQAVVRDNNRHRSGERSDYVIVDVEYAQSPGAFPGRAADFRFDMVGLRWPVAGGSRRNAVATPVIVEMKTGDAALASHALDPAGAKLSPGLARHVRDIERFLAPDRGFATSGPYELLRAELLHIFAVKKRLGLPSVPERMRALELEELTQRPEVLFVIANHVPASKALGQELLRLPERRHADYFVAMAQWMGYGLFAESKMPLDAFIADVLGGRGA